MAVVIYKVVITYHKKVMSQYLVLYFPLNIFSHANNHFVLSLFVLGDGKSHLGKEIF